MVTTFNTKDLTSFGEYLLSGKRRARYEAANEVAKQNKVPIAPVEDRLKTVSHADVENWKDSQSKVHKVRAKFKCNNVDANDVEGDSRNIQMDVVIEGSPENEEFSKYTPYGQFNIGIDKDAIALELFEEGREYYIDIIKVPLG
jgi:hypothetical protein